MDNISTVFIVQVILCTLLFILLYRLVNKNAELKKEVENLKENTSRKKIRED